VTLVAITTGLNRASWVFGVLTLVALVFVLVCLVGAIASFASTPARRSLRPVAERLGQWGLWLAFAVASVCTGGSLWLSEVCGLPPCRMCWFQRICMYPLTVVLGIGAMRRDRGVWWYALPLSIVGTGLAVYHYLLERIPSLEGGSGCEALNPCNIIWFERFGFATIPFMALTGFVTVAVLVGVAVRHPGDAAITPHLLGSPDDPLS
jgi:disulfide bond formation protein DsbB